MQESLTMNMRGSAKTLLNNTEGAKFWLSVLTELHTRGLKDIFIAAVDGLTGFPEAINAVYPKTKIQLCIVHMVRNSLRFVSWKDRKALALDLKQIYRAVNVDEAQRALDAFAQRWDRQYPAIAKAWSRHWPNLITLFDYPGDIRKVIYTTNAIESLNSVVRKAVHNRKIFPTDQSAIKVVYLAIEAASKKWSMPIHHWKAALNRFMIEFPGRMPGVLSWAVTRKNLQALGSESIIIPTITAHSLWISMVITLKPCATTRSNRPNNRFQPTSALTHRHGLSGTLARSLSTISPYISQEAPC